MQYTNILPAPPPIPTVSPQRVETPNIEPHRVDKQMDVMIQNTPPTPNQNIIAQPEEEPKQNKRQCVALDIEMVPIQIHNNNIIM